MTRRTVSATASLVAIIAAVGWGATGRAPAAEPHAVGTRVIGSDATARFIPLGINKSLVVDLPRDIRDVLVATPNIVNAIMRTNRRVYIIGANLGQTNVYFFDAEGQQIDALDISVITGSPPPPSGNAGEPAHVVTIYIGGEGHHVFLSCTSTLCLGPQQGEAPGTTHSDTVIHSLNH